MFGAPYTGYLVLVFLAGVLVLVGFDYPVGTWTVGSIAVIIPLLILGWFLCRKRITAIAQERAGFTGQFPVIANRPLADQNRRNPRRVDGVDSDPLD
jgi:L-asparagine permease